MKGVISLLPKHLFFCKYLCFSSSDRLQNLSQCQCPSRKGKRRRRTRRRTRRMSKKKRCTVINTKLLLARCFRPTDGPTNRPSKSTRLELRCWDNDQFYGYIQLETGRLPLTHSQFKWRKKLDFKILCVCVCLCVCVWMCVCVCVSAPLSFCLSVFLI